MKWFKHRIIKSKQSDRRKLAEWLAERDLDRQLADPDRPQPDVAGQETDRARAVCPDFYDQGTISAGEVRLLASVSGATTDWPLYVMVLAAPSDDTFCCIPFSRFSVPALSEEWSTGIRHAALRVLCFWNAQTILFGEMPLGWRVKRLSDRQFKQIQEMRNCFDMGTPLSAAQRKRIGPPLMHPADPRHEYMTEERARMTRHFRSVAERRLTQDEEEGLYLSEWTRDTEEWLLAAEGRERYGVAAAVYHTEDHTVIVAVYEQETDQILVRIMTHDGDPCTRYDGGYIEAETGERSATIQGGKTMMYAHLAMKRVALIDAEGKRNPLRRKRGRGTS